MADIANQLQAAAGAAGGGGGGSYLLYGSFSSTVGLLDHTTPGTLTFATSYTNAGSTIVGVAFSPDGNYVATANANNAIITLLNRPTPSTLSFATTYTRNAAMDGFQLGISWTPDSNYIALASGSSTITVLNHTTPGSLSLASTYSASTSSVDFNYDGTYLISGGGGAPNFCLTLFSFSSGTLTFAATYVAGFTTDSAKFNPTGDYIAVTRRYTTFQLFDHTTPGTLSLSTTYTYANANEAISNGISWTPDGAYVAFAAGQSGTTRNVVLLNYSGGSLSLAATYGMGGNQSVYALKFSPDGNYLGVSANDGAVKLTLINHSAGSLSLATTYSTFPYCIDWSPD